MAGPPAPERGLAEKPKFRETWQERERLAAEGAGPPSYPPAEARISRGDRSGYEVTAARGTGHPLDMDGSGNLYATKKLRDELDEKLREVVTEVPEGEEMPKDAIPVEASHVAELAGMNRRGRLAFYSERRRGASIDDAMSAARRARFR